jgi:hypothetical protein
VGQSAGSGKAPPPTAEGALMGLFSLEVELEGPAGRETVSMLVDSGATYSAISAVLAPAARTAPEP